MRVFKGDDCGVQKMLYCTVARTAVQQLKGSRYGMRSQLPWQYIPCPSLSSNSGVQRRRSGPVLEPFDSLFMTLIMGPAHEGAKRMHDRRSCPSRPRKDSQIISMAPCVHQLMEATCGRNFWGGNVTVYLVELVRHRQRVYRKASTSLKKEYKANLSCGPVRSSLVSIAMVVITSDPLFPNKLAPVGPI